MRKSEWKKLAVMGITGALLCGSLNAESVSLDQTLAAGYGWGGQQQQANPNQAQTNVNQAQPQTKANQNQMNRNAPAATGSNANAMQKSAAPNANNANKNSCSSGNCNANKPNGNPSGYGTNSNTEMKGDKANSNQNMSRAQEISMSGGTLESDKAMTEDDLLAQLNPQMKAIYQDMSPEGKALAQKYAGEMEDKNGAVRKAAEKMLEKRKNLFNK